MLGWIVVGKENYLPKRESPEEAGRRRLPLSQFSCLAGLSCSVLGELRMIPDLCIKIIFLNNDHGREILVSLNPKNG